ncbi:MAG: glycosyltransferase [Spirochaetales bacterium]|nr:glycosyltransferase [Spirochaetales bacterium]
MELFLVVLMALGLVSGIFLFAPLPSKTRYLLKSRVPASEGEDGAKNVPQISVIIPARNEEYRISNLLGSLALQDTKILEILVVDDSSTDQTAAVAGILGARVITAEPKPDGWAGKTWACWTGAQAARGELFVFLDADVVVHPQGMGALVAQWWNQGGVVSVQPFHRVRRWYEDLSSFFNLQVIPSLSLGPKTRGLFGPVIALSAQDYTRAGGHQAVKASILDDVDFGIHCRAVGIGLGTFLGGHLFEFRMYPEGFRQMYAGWTKNFLAGAGTTPTLTLFGICFWIIGVGITGVQAGFLALGSPLGILPLEVGVGLYLAYVLTLVISFPLYGNFSWVSALFFPVHLVFYAMVMGRAWILKALGGTVGWRGRLVGP